MPSTASRPPPPSDDIDDIDAITPCPSPGPTAADADAAFARHAEELGGARSPSPSSTTSGSSLRSERLDDGRRRGAAQQQQLLEAGTDGDPARLWRRMLALQQIYGCYNSARISAALESGDTGLLLPSSACLRLLNDHMAALPEETDGPARSPLAAWKTWRKRRSSS